MSASALNHRVTYKCFCYVKWSKCLANMLLCSYGLSCTVYTTNISILNYFSTTVWEYIAQSWQCIKNGNICDNTTFNNLFESISHRHNIYINFMTHFWYEHVFLTFLYEIRIRILVFEPILIESWIEGKCNCKNNFFCTYMFSNFETVTQMCDDWWHLPRMSLQICIRP